MLSQTNWLNYSLDCSCSQFGLGRNTTLSLLRDTPLSIKFSLNEKVENTSLNNSYLVLAVFLLTGKAPSLTRLVKLNERLKKGKFYYNNLSVDLNDWKLVSNFLLQFQNELFPYLDSEVSSIQFENSGKLGDSTFLLKNCSNFRNLIDFVDHEYISPSFDCSVTMPSFENGLYYGFSKSDQADVDFLRFRQDAQEEVNEDFSFLTEGDYILVSSLDFFFDSAIESYTDRDKFLNYFASGDYDYKFYSFLVNDNCLDSENSVSVEYYMMRSLFYRLPGSDPFNARLANLVFSDVIFFYFMNLQYMTVGNSSNAQFGLVGTINQPSGWTFDGFSVASSVTRYDITKQFPFDQFKFHLCSIYPLVLLNSIKKNGFGLDRFQSYFMNFFSIPTKLVSSTAPLLKKSKRLQSRNSVGARGIVRAKRQVRGKKK